MASFQSSIHLDLVLSGLDRSIAHELGIKPVRQTFALATSIWIVQPNSFDFDLAIPEGWSLPITVLDSAWLSACKESGGAFLGENEAWAGFRILDRRGTNPFGDSVILLEDSLKSPHVKEKLIAYNAELTTSPTNCSHYLVDPSPSASLALSLQSSAGEYLFLLESSLKLAGKKIVGLGWMAEAIRTGVLDDERFAVEFRKVKLDGEAVTLDALSSGGMDWPEGLFVDEIAGDGLAREKERDDEVQNEGSEDLTPLQDSSSNDSHRGNETNNTIQPRPRQVPPFWTTEERHDLVRTLARNPSRGAAIRSFAEDSRMRADRPKRTEEAVKSQLHKGLVGASKTWDDLARAYSKGTLDLSTVTYNLRSRGRRQGYHRARAGTEEESSGMENDDRDKMDEEDGAGLLGDGSSAVTDLDLAEEEGEEDVYDPIASSASLRRVDSAPSSSRREPPLSPPAPCPSSSSLAFPFASSLHADNSPRVLDSLPVTADKGNRMTDGTVDGKEGSSKEFEARKIARGSNGRFSLAPSSAPSAFFSIEPTMSPCDSSPLSSPSIRNGSFSTSTSYLAASFCPLRDQPPSFSQISQPPYPLPFLNAPYCVFCGDERSPSYTLIVVGLQSAKTGWKEEEMTACEACRKGFEEEKARAVGLRKGKRECVRMGTKRLVNEGRVKRQERCAAVE